MADGVIEFSTNLDNSDLEKKLKEAESKIESLKKKIEAEESNKSAIADQLDEAKAAADRTKESIESLKARLEELRASGNAGGAEVVSAELEKQQSAYLKQLDTITNLNDKWLQADDKVNEYTTRLRAAEAEAQKLGGAVRSGASYGARNWATASDSIKVRMRNAAASIRQSLVGAAQASRVSFMNVSASMTGILRKAAMFSLAAIGLRSIGKSLLQAAQRNAQFNASIENLKSVVSGFLDGLVGAVLPGIIAVANLIAGVLQSIGGLIDSIFGTNLVGSMQQSTGSAPQVDMSDSVDTSESMAKAQRNQADAADDLAKKQKEANKQILGFDELNVMAKDSTEDVADAVDDYEPETIEAPSVGVSGLADAFTPDAGMFQGILDWLDELKNRILNDVEGPFARIREGLQLIKKGFDEVIQGIMNGDWALVWKGIGDIVIGAMYVIEGAFGALMDWLNEITGGRFNDIFEGLKLIVHGAVEFIEGLLRGDLPLAYQGLVDIIEGIAQTAQGIVDAICGALKDGVNMLFDWLGEKFPELKPMFDAVRDGILNTIESVRIFLVGAIDGARQIIEGSLDVIIGIFTLDGDRILSGLQKMGQGVMRIFQAIWDSITTLLRPFTDWIYNNVVRPVADAFSNAWNAITNTARGAWNGIQNVFSNVANFFGNIFGNAWAAVKRAFTAGGEFFNGAIDAIVNAFKSLANTVISAINWAIAQPFYGINSVISSLRGWRILDIYPFSGFHEIEVPQIPYLAQGAVIPPNKAFMAVLGDQSNGKNLEAPESLIRQIVREEAGGVDMNALQASIVTAVVSAMNAYQQGDVVMELRVGNETLAQAVSKGNASLARRGMIKPELVI